MVVYSYGIHLKRITKDDLELIRVWRNSDYVKQFMVFKDYITPEMQVNWFRKVNNDNNFYFLIISDSNPIGLANIKDIDFNLKAGESGIFLHSPEYIDTDFGVRATLALLDFAFLNLNMEKLYQTITISNRAAYNFNIHLGVNITEVKNDIYSGFLEKEIYLKKTKNIRQFLKNKNNGC